MKGLTYAEYRMDRGGQRVQKEQELAEKTARLGELNARLPLGGKAIFEQQRLLYQSLLEWLDKFESQLRGADDMAMKISLNGWVICNSENYLLLLSLAYSIKKHKLKGYVKR